MKERIEFILGVLAIAAAGYLSGGYALAATLLIILAYRGLNVWAQAQSSQINENLSKVETAMKKLDHMENRLAEAEKAVNSHLSPRGMQSLF